MARDTLSPALQHLEYDRAESERKTCEPTVAEEWRRASAATPSLVFRGSICDLRQRAAGPVAVHS